MATANPFDLLGDNDFDDPSQLVAKVSVDVSIPLVSGVKKFAAAPQTAAVAKLPTKPVPPAQAVREAKSVLPLGRGGRGGRGFGRAERRGGRQFRDFNANEGSYKNELLGGSNAAEDGERGNPSERTRGVYGGLRAPYRGGRRGGYGNGDIGDSERQRRPFERRSGTGRGTELKRDGAGRGNWGTPTDEAFIQPTVEITSTEDMTVMPQKQPEDQDAIAEPNKEDASKETEEKEPEDKEMTLEEYEKVREEKRKALLALKAEERKVIPDKELESMQLSLKKKNKDDVFIKLGSEKDGKKKENTDKDERVKKAVSINAFLKPAEGERYYSPGGRGRGRGRGDRGGFRGGFVGNNNASTVAAPSIEDPGQFPTLGGK